MSKDKKEELRKHLPILWMSYIHLYDVRDRVIQNNIGFLLIVATFLPLLSLGLYRVDFLQHWMILIPILFHITALLILLQSFFSVRGQQVPWYELEEVLKAIDNGRFESETLAMLKAAESGTKIFVDSSRGIIKWSLFSIIFSFYAIFLAIGFILMNVNPYLYLFVLLVSTVFTILLIVYSGRTLPYNFCQRYKNNLETIEEWMDK